MPTYKHTSGKKFFFVHIPRTGGRFLEENLEKRNNFTWCDGIMCDRMYSVYEGVEVAHFHREYYEKYLDCKGIPHIALVRNPIDRFISSSIYLLRHYGECQELMEDEMMFHFMLENHPFPESCNWYRPQIDYLSEDTHIWRLEDGLGDEFASWFSGIVGVDIVLDPNIKYNKFDWESIKLKKTPKLIDNINRLYRRDYEQLYPELDPSLQEGEKTKT
tara:strand:- start:11 stop:661 length:651 start_codon:yes stop_codon:yes gene_type:complete